MTIIRDKNIFECFIKNEVIWFPNYVFWAPPSHGYIRRRNIFKKVFPEMEPMISTQETWIRLKNNSSKQYQIFQYSEETHYLKKLKPDCFVTNSYGYPVWCGQKLLLEDGIYTIDKLEGIKHAGIIATYHVEGILKKTSVNRMIWNSENDYWEPDNRSS